MSREEWIDVLRDQCMKTSQARVAVTLKQPDGFPSQAIIAQVLSGKYSASKGRKRLQALVEGKYLGVTLECPELGEIGLEECAEWQSLPFSTANTLRVDMYRACQDCPNRRDGE